MDNQDAFIYYNTVTLRVDRRNVSEKKMRNSLSLDNLEQMKTDWTQSLKKIAKNNNDTTALSKPITRKISKTFSRFARIDNRVHKNSTKSSNGWFNKIFRKMSKSGPMNTAKKTPILSQKEIFMQNGITIWEEEYFDY